MVTAQDALEDLRWNWNGAYLITGAAGHWLAQRRDDGTTLIASGPDELRALILADYSRCAVPREIAPGCPS